MTPRCLLAFAAVTGCAHPTKTPVPTTPTSPIALTAAIDPKLIEMTVEPTTSLVTAAAASELGVRVRITAKALPPANRPPLDLALVLDTSGSMEGDAIDALRASAREVIHDMRDGDMVSVIAFHSKVDVLVPLTTIDASSRTRIANAIDHIRAKGTTDLVGGLQTGAAQLQAGAHPQAIHRIVLLSDGVPNTAIQLPAVLTSLHQQQIPVTTLGFGLDYDTTVMTKIASDTGGNFHYVEKPEQIAAMFDDELTKMQTVVARNLQLVLAPGPNVSFRPMPAFGAGGGGQIIAQVGDLSAGETRDLMIPVDVVARTSGSTVEVVDATLTFTDVVNNSGSGTRDGFVSVKASSDPAAVKAAVKVGLEVARVRASAASAMLEAIAMARAGQIDQARKKLDGAAAEVKTAIKRLGDNDLTGVLQELEAVGKDLTQLVMVQPPPAPVRKAPIAVEETEMPTDMPVPAAQPAVAPPAVERHLRKAQDAAVQTVNGR